MTCLDQLQSEICGKLDKLAAADAAAIQREAAREAATYTALICIGAAIAFATAMAYS